jgi:hypothetical protein
VHAATEDKCEGTKDSFYVEMERMLDKFSKYHFKLLLGDFTAKVGREHIVKSTIGNERSQETSNCNGVRAVNFGTPKSIVVKSTRFHFVKFINTLRLLLMEEHTIRLITSW